MSSEPQPTEVPARYVLLGVLGQGGMGKVYRARDTQLDREVAIKVIDKSEIPNTGTTDRASSVERFIREARAAARLDHPNIVAVHDVDPEAGWLVMSLVEGTSLQDARIPLPPRDVRKIAEQVLSALEAAHGAGVIHRDIKPANIIVDGALKVTLIDFGVARLLDGAMTQTGERSIGTPAYMAPEQMRGGAVDARTDLYGLGATLYELVTGERMIAFETPSPDALDRVRLACGEQAGLARVIDHCLRAAPDDRFDSATMALAALVNASETNLMKLARRVSKAQPVATPKRRWPWLVLALILVGGGAGAFVLTRTRGPDPRITAAFVQAQRGEHERAGQLLDDYLGSHPDDPDALSLRALTAWWDGSNTEELVKRALATSLTPAQRAMVRGIELSVQQRDAEATALLTSADREIPNTPEIIYMLGEMQFHAFEIDTGVATLERAFRIDPRWQVALHHVIERKLALGTSADELLALLRPNDASSAATWDCRVANAKHDHRAAAAIARDAIAKEEAVAELHICLAQALTLAGDLDGAQVAVARARELWPIDLREWGGFTHAAEQLLYRGRLDDYLKTVRNRPSRPRTLAIALWQPPNETPEVTTDRASTTPLGAAIATLVRARTGQPIELATIREPEVRLFAEGVVAERANDPTTAVAKYRAALATPALGDIAMLVSHHLARTLYAAGDRAGAATACRAVFAPAVYHPYRAILIPDCTLWSHDQAADRALVKAWASSAFQHPAVVEIRKRLAE